MCWFAITFESIGIFFLCGLGIEIALLKMLHSVLGEMAYQAR